MLIFKSYPSVLPDAVELARELVAHHLEPGDAAIDATMGNGHDTLWLARLVGPGGLVVGCDLQAAAVEATRKRIQQAGLLARSRLEQLDHLHVSDKLTTEEKSRVRVVMFNLGYLPGSDKTITTVARHTLGALETIGGWLGGGSLITIVAYPGHDGGAEERDSVLAWAAQLDPHQWRTQHWRTLNRRRPAPELVAAERLPDGLKNQA